MPFFYAFNYTATSSSSANNTSDAGKITSGSNVDGRIVGVYIAAYSTTAGGFDLRVTRTQTSGTGGTSYTLLPRDGTAPAAVSTASTNNTTAASGTLTTQLTVGAPATGGMGGWIMVDPDAAIKLNRGGSTTSGNVDLLDICAVASVTADLTVEVCEN